MSIILLLLVYCTYLVFFTLLIVNMYISNAGPHQPMAASFFNLQDQIKYVCMYVCMYKKFTRTSKNTYNIPSYRIVALSD